MKSEHELDADLSQRPAPDAKPVAPEETAAATERDELSDEQIATITGGAVVHPPPPLKIGN